MMDAHSSPAQKQRLLETDTGKKAPSTMARVQVQRLPTTGVAGDNLERNHHPVPNGAAMPTKRDWQGWAEGARVRTEFRG
mmetsp:Transcript_108954/g.188590  ORF Transcript_108954/g.188590 Transcript_108954/m.188590 type:complete len:80 (-) Transcript_108954:3028-3267(-)